jgi:hypothetical protein
MTVRGENWSDKMGELSDTLLREIRDVKGASGA